VTLRISADGDRSLSGDAVMLALDGVCVVAGLTNQSNEEGALASEHALPISHSLKVIITK